MGPGAAHQNAAGGLPLLGVSVDKFRMMHTSTDKVPNTSRHGSLQRLRPERPGGEERLRHPEGTPRPHCRPVAEPWMAPRNGVQGRSRFTLPHRSLRAGGLQDRRYCRLRCPCFPVGHGPSTAPPTSMEPRNLQRSPLLLLRLRLPPSAK